MAQLLQSWRWYGPSDPVSLGYIRQAGAEGIVTALHHIPIGHTWEEAEVLRRKQEIEKAGLKWSVIESLPLHEDIKLRSGNYQEYIENYKKSLRNISKFGIDIICYNFMPVLDWTRTNLDLPYKDGSTALSFDLVALAAFDLYILNRDGAENSYTPDICQEAEMAFSAMDEDQRSRLVATITAGLPGGHEALDMDAFVRAHSRYEGIGTEHYRDNLKRFLDEVIPVARQCGIRMAIHPDDPPFDILGLPRVVSTAADIKSLFDYCDDPFHGFTFCAGSLASREDNDVIQIFRKIKDRVHFVHLRNVSLSSPKSFTEENHLEGRVDMYALVKALTELPEYSAPLPYRPDHGHRMLDDLNKNVNPGYSAIGRLRGLAELRGLEMGIRRNLSSNMPL